MPRTPTEMMNNEQPNEPSFQPEPETLVLEDRSLRHGFVQLPKLVLHARNLSRDAKLLYAILLGYAWQERRCFPGYRRLCADMLASENMVRKYMRELEAVGLLGQKRRGLGKTNLYTLRDLRTAELAVLDPQDGAGLDRTQTAGNKDPANQEADEQISIRRVAVREERREGARQETTSAGVTQVMTPDRPPRPDVAETMTVARSAVRNAEIRKAARGEDSRADEQSYETADDRRRPSTAPIASTSGSVGRDEGAIAPITERSRAAWSRQVSSAGLASIGTVLSRRPIKAIGETKNDDQQVITAYLREVASQFSDRLPIAISARQALSLYYRSGANRAAFLGALFEARAITKDRCTGTPGRHGSPRTAAPRRPMAFFFTVLADILGLRASSQESSP